MAAAITETWKAVDLVITASWGLSPTAFFTALAAVVVLYYTVAGCFAAPPPLRSREADVPEQLGEITLEELRQYDGSDPKKPLLMAIKGQIYDVSQSSMFYGPEGPYALFAGRDTSRALSRLSIEEKDLTGDVSGLGPFELNALQDWEQRFMRQYTKVGTIKKETIPREAGEQEDANHVVLREVQKDDTRHPEQTIGSKNRVLKLKSLANSEDSSEALLPLLHPSAVTQDDLKHIAAHHAVDLVESGMVLGLGTGSTAFHAIERIGELLRQGKLHSIVGIPTSKKTEAHAISLGIPLTNLGSHPTVDLSIDGADEVDPHFNLVKGRGGSLLREKMIEGASRRFVVIVDDTKLVERIGGSGLAVPVEVIPFGWQYTLVKVKSVFDQWGGCEAKLRVRKGAAGEEIPCETDNLNYVVDLYFDDGIRVNLDEVSNALLRITGVVEHGMFLGLATSVIVAGRDGIVVKSRE